MVPDAGNAFSPSPDTFFASAERAGAAEVAVQVQELVGNGVMDALLQAAGGVVVVLNEYRQILAFNPAFLETMGISDAGAVLGIRVGEAIDCAHAHDLAAGCGTNRFCRNCGAAIALILTQATGKVAERDFALTRSRDGVSHDMLLRARSGPLQLGRHKLVLLFLQDITEQHWHRALERVFVHDVANAVTSLKGALDMAAKEGDKAWLPAARELAVSIAREVQFHRALCSAEIPKLEVETRAVPVSQIVDQLKNRFVRHPLADAKVLRYPDQPSARVIQTDPSLCLRVLTNMMLNALEATDSGGEVRLRVDEKPESVVFSLWNRKPIPGDVSLRVFQRYFTTHEGPGRGLGTFSMKLICDRFLGGRVGFTSTPEEGTTFRFELPMKFVAPVPGVGAI